ncbi:MAG: PKD domain-containing protein [Candidatus Omnitrophica bacterium]|nr:PKD domain-containing protein [Candidatus Omnitrophota bacterium]
MKKLFSCFCRVLILSFLFPLMISAEEAKTPLTSQRCNVFTFDSTGSYDPDNQSLSILWNFGDGQTSTETTVDHTYEKSGDYTATLTVKKNIDSSEFAQSIATQTVRANIPPYATFTAPEVICSNQPALFDATASYDKITKDLGYEWDFGDTTKNNGSPVISKIYAKGGKYKVSLTVDDNRKTACSKKTFEKEITVNNPPTASAGPEEVLKCVSQEADYVVNFSGANSTDVNNDKLTYLWDFGDGDSAEGIETSHKYKDIGNYDVKLIVKDNTNVGCGTAVAFESVKLSKAPLAVAGEPALVCPGEPVSFDGSKSIVYKKGTVSANWIFGDGESKNGFTTTHTYIKPGTYQATLSIADELNKMCPESKATKTVTVNAAPTISLKAEEFVCSTSPVQFEASANDPDGGTLEYYWSFGDGEISKGVSKIAHKYNQGGAYRATVIVDDSKGTNCSTATAEVQVRVNTPPIADAGPNKVRCVGIETEFNASASSDPDGDHLTYVWDFGDGTKASGPIVKHSFVKSGKYNVNVTVDDNSGSPCSHSSAGFVTEVNAKPVPVMNIR